MENSLIKDFSLPELIKKWIAEQDLVKAKWSIKPEKTNHDMVLVSGTLIVKIGNKSYSLKGSCQTNRNEASIGQALQALNQDMLEILKNI